MSATNFTTLSGTCQTGLFAAQDCFNNPENAFDLCKQCGDVSEALFQICSHNDFQNSTVPSSYADKCHKEDGKLCLPGQNSTINIQKCSDTCSQYFATMQLETKDSSFWDNGDSKIYQNVKDCAAKYPNDLQIGKNAASASSMMAVSFAVVTASTFLFT
eukprot:NODE_394_length_8135_cov_0.672847.p6 type:complete len:159 gc:universal NODE_394_length_8135_cov_0.672847:5776-6252(+)